MGLFDSIIGTALGVSGAFDNSKKTDKAAAFGAAFGASLGSGKKWTMADSIRLGAALSALDEAKEDSSFDYILGGSSYSSSDEISFDDESDELILTSEQEELLEEAGIDIFDFECMDEDEKIETLEDAGLDPFDFIL